MTPLGTMMIEELRLRDMAESTERTYLYQVSRLSRRALGVTSGAAPQSL